MAELLHEFFFLVGLGAFCFSALVLFWCFAPRNGEEDPHPWRLDERDDFEITPDWRRP